MHGANHDEDEEVTLHLGLGSPTGGESPDFGSPISQPHSGRRDSSRKLSLSVSRKSSFSNLELARLCQGRRGIKAVIRLTERVGFLVGNWRKVRRAFCTWTHQTALKKANSFLRSVITDRTEFMDELREAYLRDIVIVKQQLVKHMRSSKISVPEEVYRLPSIDLRQYLKEKWNFNIDGIRSGAGSVSGRSEEIHNSILEQASLFLKEITPDLKEGQETIAYGDYLGLVDVSLPLYSPEQCSLFLKPCNDCLGISKLIHQRTRQVEQALKIMPRFQEALDEVRNAQHREILLGQQYTELQGKLLEVRRKLKMAEGKLENHEGASRWLLRQARLNVNSDTVIEKLKNEVVDAKNTLYTQKMQWEESQKTFEIQVAKDKQEYEDQIARLKEQIDVFKKEHTEMANENSFCKQVASDAKKETEDYEKQMEEMKKEFEQMRDENEHMMKRLEQHNAKRFTVMDENNRLKLEINTLQEQINQLDKDNEQIHQETTNLKKALAKAEGQKSFKKDQGIMVGSSGLGGKNIRVQCDLLGLGPMSKISSLLGISSAVSVAGRLKRSLRQTDSDLRSLNTFQRQQSGDSSLDICTVGEDSTLAGIATLAGASVRASDMTTDMRKWRDRVKKLEGQLKNSKRSEAAIKARMEQKLLGLQQELETRVAEERKLTETQRMLVVKLTGILNMMRNNVDQVISGIIETAGEEDDMTPEQKLKKQLLEETRAKPLEETMPSEGRTFTSDTRQGGMGFGGAGGFVGWHGGSSSPPQAKGKTLAISNGKGERRPSQEKSPRKKGKGRPRKNSTRVLGSPGRMKSQRGHRDPQSEKFTASAPHKSSVGAQDHGLEEQKESKSNGENDLSQDDNIKDPPTASDVEASKDMDSSKRMIKSIKLVVNVNRLHPVLKLSSKIPKAMRDAKTQVAADLQLVEEYKDVTEVVAQTMHGSVEKLRLKISALEKKLEASYGSRRNLEKQLKRFQKEAIAERIRAQQNIRQLTASQEGLLAKIDGQQSSGESSEVSSGVQTPIDGGKNRILSPKDLKQMLSERFASIPEKKVELRTLGIQVGDWHSLQIEKAKSVLRQFVRQIHATKELESRLHLEFNIVKDRIEADADLLRTNLQERISNLENTIEEMADIEKGHFAQVELLNTDIDKLREENKVLAAAVTESYRFHCSEVEKAEQIRKQNLRHMSTQVTCVVCALHPEFKSQDIHLASSAKYSDPEKNESNAKRKFYNADRIKKVPESPPRQPFSLDATILKAKLLNFDDHGMSKPVLQSGERSQSVSAVQLASQLQSKRRPLSASAGMLPRSMKDNQIQNIKTKRLLSTSRSATALPMSAQQPTVFQTSVIRPEKAESQDPTSSRRMSYTPTSYFKELLVENEVQRRQKQKGVMAMSHSQSEVVLPPKSQVKIGAKNNAWTKKKQMKEESHTSSLPNLNSNSVDNPQVVSNDGDYPTYTLFH